jgi:hypothetical protein
VPGDVIIELREQVSIQRNAHPFHLRPPQNPWTLSTPIKPHRTVDSIGLV